MMHLLRSIRLHLVLTAALLGLPLQACFDRGPVQVLSWKVLVNSPAAIILELQLKGSDLKGPLFIRAFAKSGSKVLTHLAIPALVSEGPNARLVTIVAPVDPSAFQMDSIVLEWFDPRGTVVGQKTVAYDYSWASRTDTLVSARSVRENDDAGLQMFFEGALAVRDWSVIDQVFAAYPDADERDPSGGNPESAFRAASILMADARTQDYVRTVEQWRSSAPQSAPALVAEVIGLEEQAVLSNSGPEVAGRVGLMRADKLLDKSKSFASVMPLWYHEKLSIAIALGKDPHTVGVIFKEAVERFPQFRDLYIVMLFYNFAETRTVNWPRTKYVVDLASEKTRAADGDSAYANLYATLGDSLDDPRELFVDGGVLWRIMQPSFEDLVARYPSNLNFNRYASYACVAGDKETFLRIWSRLGANIYKPAWPRNHSPDLCEHRFLSPA